MKVSAFPELIARSMMSVSSRFLYSLLSETGGRFIKKSTKKSSSTGSYSSFPGESDAGDGGGSWGLGGRGFDPHLSKMTELFGLLLALLFNGVDSSIRKEGLNCDVDDLGRIAIQKFGFLPDHHSPFLFLPFDLSPVLSYHTPTFGTYVLGMCSIHSKDDSNDNSSW